MMEIEKGVNLPPGKSHFRNDIIETIKSMEIGDSFFVPVDLSFSTSENKKNIFKMQCKYLNVINQYRLKPGSPHMKFASRTVSGGLRFWRIE